MPTIKTSQQIQSELKQFVKARDPSIDVGDGSIISDILLRPMSVVGEILYAELQKAVDLQIIMNLSGTDLENEGTNYGIYRLPGIKATGTVIFISQTEPIANIVIPINARMATAGTGIEPATVFLTTQTVVLLYSQRASYFNPETGWWEIEVPVICDSYGSSGNVAQERIENLLTPITGINAVENREATTGGEDLETDARMRKRIRAKILGREIGVKNGIEGFLMTEVGFPDVLAILPSSPSSERADGTDLFCVDESSTQYVQQQTYFTAQTDYQLLYPPVISVSVVQGAVAGILIPITDYETIKDTTSTRRLSPLALEYVRITPAGQAKLAEGEILTIVYTYPSDLHSAWDLLHDPANLIIFADPYTKKAIKWVVDIKAQVSFFANVDTATEKTRIENALIEYFNQYALGTDIQDSDIIVVMQTGYGDYPISSVDQVIITEIKATSVFGDVEIDAGAGIQLDDKGYARFGSITFL
jgi:uncharacterized phage protein gp47/JayE